MAHPKVVNMPCRLASQIGSHKSNCDGDWLYLDRDTNSVSYLKDQLQAAHSNIAFLQDQHALMLQGLYDEIDRLQRTCKTLQMKTELRDLLASEESFKQRISELELEIAHCHQRSDWLTKDLEQSNSVIAALDEKFKLQEWQYQQQIEEQKKIIARLECELEIKCSTIADLNTKLNYAKKKSIFQRISLSSPGLPSLSLPSFSKPTRLSTGTMSARSSPSPPYQDSGRSFSLPSEKLPSIHIKSKLSTPSCVNSSSSSTTLSSDSICDACYHQYQTLSASHNITQQNNYLSIEKTGPSSYPQSSSSNFDQRSTSGYSTGLTSVRLPPIPTTCQTFSPRRFHVRRQIRIYEDNVNEMQTRKNNNDFSLNDKNNKEDT